MKPAHIQHGEQWSIGPTALGRPEMSTTPHGAADETTTPKLKLFSCEIHQC
jgi:hypothetical protein